MNTKAEKAAMHVMMILADNTPHGPTEYAECLKVVTGAIAGYFSPGMAELLELRKQRDAALKLADLWEGQAIKYPLENATSLVSPYTAEAVAVGQAAVRACANELRAIFAPKEEK